MDNIFQVKKAQNNTEETLSEEDQGDDQEAARENRQKEGQKDILVESQEEYKEGSKPEDKY